MTALAVGMIIGPRIGKYTEDGKANAMPGHDMTMVLIGCFILAFGWFGFNPGSTLGASGQREPAHRFDRGEHDARRMHRFDRVSALHVDAVRQARRLDGGQWAARGPGRDHGAERLRQYRGRGDHRLLRRHARLFERRVHRTRDSKVDDPVGAISVHGTCGLWGVISVGLFADGTSNYGGSWNGVNGSVTGLFYGDPSQFVAQLIGCATLMGIIFTIVLRLQLDGGHYRRPDGSGRKANWRASTYPRWARSVIRNFS